MLLSIVPIAYICLKFFHIPPEEVFLIHICVEIVTEFVRLFLVLPMIHMSIKHYIIKVLFPVVFIAAISPIVPLIVNSLIDSETSNFFVVCFTCIVYNSLIIYFIGCTTRERSFVNTQLSALYNKVSKFKNS